MEKINLIILGVSGSGKSSLCNSLLGESLFKKGSGFMAVTKSCQKEVFTLKNSAVTVVDTPGLFDTDRQMDVATQALKITEALKMCKRQVHAFLIVIKFDRHTQNETSLIDVLRLAFGEQCLKQAIVVVTHVGEDVTDETFEEDCNKITNLKQFKGRFARIDNTNPTPKDIGCILKKVHTISLDGNQIYQNEYQKFHEEVLKKKAALNVYDSTLVHKQVEALSQEIEQKVEKEIKEANQKREADEKRRLEKEEKKKAEKKRNEKMKFYGKCAAVGCFVCVFLYFFKVKPQTTNLYFNVPQALGRNAAALV